MGALLSITTIVAGCSTPLEQCVSNATNDYRIVQRVISEAEGNVARGYALHTESIPYTVNQTCYRNDPITYVAIPYSCPQTAYRTQTTPVAIDVAEERRKLTGYRKLAPQYAAQANAGIAQCEAQFPADS